MIALLGWIVDGVVAIGTYVLWAVETAFDAIGVALAAAVTAAFALLPSMSSAPAIGTPTWLEWLNWFYPVSDLVAGLTALVTMFVVFLAVRYILRLARAL